MKSLPGDDSCTLIISAIIPPTPRKNRPCTKYSVPIFLWSVLVSHSVIQGAKRPHSKPSGLLR